MKKLSPINRNASLGVLTVLVGLAVASAQQEVINDGFSGQTLADHWRFNAEPFENGVIDVAGGLDGGAMQIAVTALEGFWGGFSLATERTFSASEASPLTYEITRVEDNGVGITRSGIWITNQERTRYILFSQNVGEGGWQYNRRIGEAGDSATGAGVNIDAFDAFDESFGTHRMKIVANGSLAQLYLDGQLGAEVPFPVTENIILEFGVYARDAGDEAVASFDDALVTSDLPTGLPCVSLAPSAISMFSGASETATLSVPKLFLADKGASITVRSSDPSVVTLSGATNGELKVDFSQGSENTRQIGLNALGGGSATLEIIAPEPLCVTSGLNVSVFSSFVRDPSFEITPHPGGVGYGTIDNWEGGSGINNGGPFGDNGAIPDGAQIAFTQGSKGLSQEISGLDPAKTYWLQFFYNVRDCCGGTIDLVVRFDDQELGKVVNVRPVGGTSPYHFFSAPFKPEGATGTISLESTAVGDASILYDAVTIVERGDTDIVVANPSFEASGVPPAPGYLNPAGLAGWVGVGGYGVNVSGIGPFADNGAAPDQDMAAFIQGEGSSLSQEIVGLIPNAEYTLIFAYNARGGNTPTLQVAVDDTILWEDAVSPVGDRNPYPTKSVSFVASKTRQTIHFTQTAAGDNSILLDDIRLTGEVSGIPCVPVDRGEFAATIGQTGRGFTLSIPEEAVADGPLALTITNSNPASIHLNGASNDGSVSLTISSGDALDIPVTFEALAGGVGSIAFQANKPICYTHESVNYRVIGSVFRNPGFESNAPAPFPTYGNIDFWERSGNAGVNNMAGPFHDNGMIPDGAQVGFVQVSNTLSQDIASLTPGEEHWLQFYYNVRNCCGGTLSFQVKFNDVLLFEASDVQPVGPDEPYYFVNQRFTPDVPSGRFVIETIVDGDASLTFDAFTITKRSANEVLVVNPSFESIGAYTLPFPGYMQPLPLSGWTATGNYGINSSGEGPFADNGKTSDQDSVVFLQNAGSSILQTITSLTAGQSYTLSFSTNARSGNAPRLVATINGQTAFDDAVQPVGGENPYVRHEFTFQATGATADLVFTQAADGDHTVLIDDVRVTASQVVVACVEVGPGSLTIGRGESRNLQVTVPASTMAGRDEITILVASADPAIVDVAGGSLTFTQGGPLTQTLGVNALAGGATVLNVTAQTDGVCLSRDVVAVQVPRNHLSNSGFEDAPPPAYPGYGDVESWVGSGGVGVNDGTGPFHDNGLIPDRGQVAFMQGAASLSQLATNLQPGQTYALAFYYNTRNCCGDAFASSLTALVDGAEVVRIDSIEMVGAGAPYHFATANFVATSDTAEVRFESTAVGDATALLDAISITLLPEGEILVANGSFEAGGVPPSPGYVRPNPIAGWLAEGDYGVNVSGLGPFADNGTNADQDAVLFLQNTSSVRQVVEGLTPGVTYTLRFAYNARSGNTPRLVVAVDGAALLETDVTAVGGSVPYHRGEVRFTAASASAEVALGQVADGDQTVLLDDIHLVPGDAGLPLILPSMKINRLGDSASITWTVGDGEVLLEESTDLKTWTPSGLTIQSNGIERQADSPLETGGRYFRLKR